MAAVPNAAHRSTVAWLGWLCVAASAHFMIALFGVLSRYLMVKAAPPAPSLRLLLLISIMGAATQLLFYTIPVSVARFFKKRRQKQGKRPQEAGGSLQPLPALEAPSMEGLPSEAVSVDLESSNHGVTMQGGERASAQQPGQEGEAVRKLRVQQPKSSVRPEVPLQRGLSARFERLETHNPRLVRLLAVTSLTVCGVGAGALQIGALKFVDASIVQLVNMFTVIFLSLFQAVVLRHRIPRMLWPTAAVMVGGAALIIVPTIQRGGTGGLGSAKSFLGLGLAVGYMLCMCTYMIILQASRHMGLSSTDIQYCFMAASIVVLTPISLPLEGVNWAADMGPWNAADWVVLVVLGTVVCIGAGVLIQHATWKLGAPTVSLFYGMRLVFTVVQSKIILHATIIQTGLQIAGIVVTVGAVTLYMGWQWWNFSRQAALANKAAVEAGEDSEGEAQGSQLELKKLGEAVEKGVGAKCSSEGTSSNPEGRAGASETSIKIGSAGTEGRA